MRINFKSFVVNLSIFALSFLLFLCIAELALRFFSHKPEKSQELVYKGGDEYDPILGWKKIPNARIERINEEGQEYALSFNSKGIRRPDYPYNKKDILFTFAGYKDRPGQACSGESVSAAAGDLGKGVSARY